MRVARTAVAAATCLLLVLTAACTGQGKEEPSKSPTPTPTSTGPSSKSGRAKDLSSPTDALGTKWAWNLKPAVAAARKTPGGSTFFEAERCDIERKPGSGDYDWKEVDRIVRRSKALGYALMLKIRAGSCGTKNADEGNKNVGSKRKTPSALPDDMDAYQKFVRAFVERYSAKGVHWFAVENEVNARNFWSGSYADFTTLAKATASTIRDTDPKARVLDPGLASATYAVVVASDLLEQGKDDEALRVYRTLNARRLDGGATPFKAADDVDQLRSVLTEPLAKRAVQAAKAVTALDRQGVFDVYQLHFYEDSAAAPEVLSWIRANVPSDMPIESWETGVAWPGDGFSDAVQADETAKVVATLLAGGVSRVVYLPLETPDVEKVNKQPLFRGLYERDGKIRPAGYTYNELYSMLANDADVEPVKASGLDGIAVSKGARTEFVVWGSEEKDVDAASGVKVRSATGAEAKSSGGSVTIGRSPVFVSWPKPLDQAQRALAR